MLFALALVAGCGQGGPVPGGAPAASSASPEITRARELIQETAILPPRAETVAVADAVAIAAHRSGRTAEGASLSMLAADLRARLWRLDQTLSDAREAVELYGAASLAAPTVEEGCEADRRRALLAGDLARDAGLAYRELYLASRRQEGRASPDGGPAAPPASRCLSSVDMALAAAVAYRPSGEAMRALEHDGDLAAGAARRGAASPLLGAMPSGVADRPPASAAVAPDGSAAPGGDVVVSPKEDAVGKDPVKVVAVEPLSGEDAARVVIRLSAPATFQVGVLGADGAQANPRVFVDVARASSKGLAREIAGSGLVRRVRLGAHAGGTRIVLDLSAVAARRVFYLPDPFRIVVDVGTRVRAEASAPGAPREVRRVAVDPGHGGTDAGAVGPTGLKEKDVTLDIAHRLAPLLAHELGVETLLTRDSDAYVPLDLRAARANTFHADLFISIHCNASENGAARGVQTFVLDEARDPDGVAAKVAARENAQRGRDAATGADLAAVLMRLNPAELSARSRHVADLLQRSALGSLQPRYPDTRDQGVKTAGFFVLVGADMPAVLFETAFISNADEEGRLATADYRQKLADSILNAVRAYKAGK